MTIGQFQDMTLDRCLTLASSQFVFPLSLVFVSQREAGADPLGKPSRSALTGGHPPRASSSQWATMSPPRDNPLLGVRAICSDNKSIGYLSSWVNT